MLERLLADWPLKGLAMVIAFAIWVSITGEGRAVKDLRLPVEVQLREDRILGAAPPTTVTVRLEGPETLIRKLEAVGLAVRLQLGEAPPGQRDVQLEETHVTGLPPRVAVTLFDPDRLTLTVDRRKRRELRVVADVVGQPPEGYYLYRTRVRPETVVVEGPEAAVDALAQLRTDPIRLEHRTRTFVETVGSVPDGAQVRVVNPQPLEVRVVIDAAPVEMAFDGVPVLLSGQDYEAAVTPDTLKVILTGPPTLLKRLTPAQIRAVADITELRPGRQAHRVAIKAGIVDLPEDQLWRIGVKSIDPVSVYVRVSERSVSG